MSVILNNNLRNSFVKRDESKMGLLFPDFSKYVFQLGINGGGELRKTNIIEIGIQFRSDH